MVAMHGNFVLAQDVSQEAPIPQQDEALQLDEREASTITWPLLSGENVQGLSRLFYPKDKRMQRLFIQKTLHLSQEIRPNLSAYTTTNQASLIVIPNIKYLAKHSGKIRRASPKKAHSPEPATQPELHMSYGLKDADKFALTPEMQTKYEDLVKRNEKLKQDLDKLNAKLAHLQEVMAALNVEARRVQSLPAVAETSIVDPKPTSVETASIKVVNSVVKEPTAPKVIKSTLAESAVVTQILPNTSQEPFYVQYWKQLLALLASGSLVAAYLYRRKHGKTFSRFSAEVLHPSYKNETIAETIVEPTPPAEVDFALTSSDFSSSVSEVQLNAITSLKDKEEGDLVLEQAKIYVNINREKEAIMILKAQIRSAPKASFDHWMLLLDIYRKNNQQDEFINSADELHEIFNVMKPTWKNLPVLEGAPTSLLEFPHIIEHLMRLWTASSQSAIKLLETKMYLDNLLTDTRENERLGFNLDVFLEIKLLRDILDIRDTLANKA